MQFQLLIYGQQQQRIPFHFHLYGALGPPFDRRAIPLPSKTPTQHTLLNELVCDKTCTFKP